MTLQFDRLLSNRGRGLSKLKSAHVAPPPPKELLIPCREPGAHPKPTSTPSKVASEWHMREEGRRTRLAEKQEARDLEAEEPSSPCDHMVSHIRWFHLSGLDRWPIAKHPVDPIPISGEACLHAVAECRSLLRHTAVRRQDEPCSWAHWRSAAVPDFWPYRSSCSCDPTTCRCDEGVRLVGKWQLF